MKTVHDLSSSQLKRAAAIKERLHLLTMELQKILGDSSAAVKGHPSTKKKRMSAATRAKLRAKLKAYWRAKKAGRK